MDSFELNQEEIKALDNAQGRLYRVASQLAGVLNPQLLSEIGAALEAVKSVNRRRHTLLTEIEDAAREYWQEWGFNNNLKSQWCLTEVGQSADEPTNFGNRQVLVYAEHFGDEEVVVTIPGPTWGDLYKAADAAITASGDEHHCFIEGFEVRSDGRLYLSTGS